MYDPTVGRWLGEDPIVFEAGQANTSVYCGNDPVSRTDPNGLQESIGPGYGAMPVPFAHSEHSSLLTEAGCKAQLKKLAETWRANHWELAATLLEYFLNHKGGKTTDVCDVSPLAGHVSGDPQLNHWLHEYLVRKARENCGFWEDTQTTITLQEELGDWRWVMGQGEPFYAFGGIELSVNGTLKITKTGWGYSSLKWEYTGDVIIEDTYRFPVKWYRMLFNDYRAAQYLESLGYKRFHVYMKFETTMSGDGTYWERPGGL